MANGQPSPFGTLLQRYRAAAGLTQEALAARAQLSSDAIAALERGRRRTPRVATAHLLAAALDLTDAERAALLAAESAAPLSGFPLAPDARAKSTSRALSAVPPTPLINREGELAMIRQRLVAEGARLLTLTGPAGVGKTRLALAAVAEVAEQFPDGVTLVDLSPIHDPSLVLNTMAHAVGLADTGSRPVLDRLGTFLHERAVLLVLDNFEQVLPAATTLADLLAGCPSLTLLVTSRVPLQLRWERTLRVPPLAVPDLSVPLPPLDELARIPSVALFVERAQTRRADFALSAAQAPLVAQLAVELDGLPLALELAAARLDALPLSLITRRLEDRLRLLRWEAPDLPERHRSLEAAVGWSYDLLPDNQRWMFRCLGVFVGQVALDALATVVGHEDEGCMVEGMASLAEKSLALPGRQDEEDDEECELCYGMLETVREYAQEQLARHGELEAARRAHARYFLALAERADPQLRGRGQREWYFRLEREHDNLRAALRWLLDQDGPADREAALRLAGALGYFWWLRGYHVEGVRWLERALLRAPAASDLEDDGATVAARSQAQIAAGKILALQGEFDRARAVLEEALDLAQRRHDPAGAAQALTELGLVPSLPGNGRKAPGCCAGRDATGKARAIPRTAPSRSITLALQLPGRGTTRKPRRSRRTRWSGSRRQAPPAKRAAPASISR